MSDRRDLRRIGYNISNHVMRRNTDLKRLSNDTGIPLNSVYQYARGAIEMPATRLKMIAVALECTCDDLLEGVCE